MRPTHELLTALGSGRIYGRDERKIAVRLRSARVERADRVMTQINLDSLLMSALTLGLTTPSGRARRRLRIRIE